MCRKATGLLLITAFASCGSPQLQPRVLGGPLSTPELIKGAEIIIVGTITSITFGKVVHTSVPLFPQLNDCLVPVRISVSVENVLRGSIPNRLNFEYFGTVCGTMGPVESPQGGSRSMFFLRNDSGRWRPLADYWRNRIPVLTGRHGNELLVGKPIEEAISEILLTPSDNYTTAGLVQALATATSESSSLIGPSATERLLVPLLNHSDMQVRVQACLELNAFGNSFEDCARRLVDENLDLMARQGFGAISPGLAVDLERLANYSDPDTISRAQRLLPFSKIAAPPAPTPLLPPALR